MFIKIYGTSGAGKSTLMRRVMDNLLPAEKDPHHLEYHWTDKKTQKPRKKEFILGHMHGKRDFVVGSYSTACGGMDSLSAPGMLDSVYLSLRGLADGGARVFMEGLVQLSSSTRPVTLADTYPVHAIFLNTPFEVCLERVKFRREARGNMDPLDPTNTRRTYDNRLRQMQNMKGTKVNLHHVSPEDAYEIIKELLNAGT